MGCMGQAGLGQAPARQAAIHAGLHHEAICTTINKVIKLHTMFTLTPYRHSSPGHLHHNKQGDNAVHNVHSDPYTLHCSCNNALSSTFFSFFLHNLYVFLLNINLFSLLFALFFVKWRWLCMYRVAAAAWRRSCWPSSPSSWGTPGTHPLYQ